MRMKRLNKKLPPRIFRRPELDEIDKTYIKIFLEAFLIICVSWAVVVVPLILLLG